MKTAQQMAANLREIGAAMKVYRGEPLYRACKKCRRWLPPKDFQEEAICTSCNPQRSER